MDSQDEQNGYHEYLRSFQYDGNYQRKLKISELERALTEYGQQCLSPPQ